MGFRSLALQKRSSEVWQLLGAIKTEFERYGNVVNTLSKQLTTASTSVESLGRRTRAMSRKLKGVETLPDDKTAESLLGFSADDFIGGSDEGGIIEEESALA
jgi:DNA recombination protein RmuC